MSSTNTFLMLEPKDAHDLLEGSHWEIENEFIDPINYYSSRSKELDKNDDVTIIEGKLTVSF